MVHVGSSLVILDFANTGALSSFRTFGYADSFILLLSCFRLESSLVPHDCVAVGSLPSSRSTARLGSSLSALDFFHLGLSSALWAIHRLCGVRYAWALHYMYWILSASVCLGIAEQGSMRLLRPRATWTIILGVWFHPLEKLSFWRSTARLGSFRLGFSLALWGHESAGLLRSHTTWIIMSGVRFYPSRQFAGFV